MVRRFGIALWILGTTLTATMLPLAPPDVALGAPAGWTIAGAALVVGAVLTGRLVRRAEVSRDELLLESIVAVVAISGLAALSHSEVYEGLLLLPTVYCAVVHPPVRALLVAGLAVASSIALVGVTNDATPAEETIARSLVWLGLAGLAVAWSAGVRRERRRLMDDTAAEHARAHEDALTRLGNRRAFETGLRIELARAARTGEPLTLMVLDLDDFKQVNDAHGHPAGDRVLRETAEALAAASRPPDRWFRWGGDEFSGLYPATGAADAAAVCERLRGDVARSCRRPDGRPLRAQVGCAQWRRGTTGEQLTLEADTALLAAKSRRRAPLSAGSAGRTRPSACAPSRPWRSAPRRCPRARRT
jgi:diguanylate cyclase (GGDEF)-like protein